MQCLKFKGRRLTVSLAAEPDQLGWENLDASKLEKVCLRVRSAIIAVVLLLVCFAIIVQGSIYKSQFSDSIPNLSTCSLIPHSFGRYNASLAGTSTGTFTRPPTELRSHYDGLCTGISSSSFYAILAYDGVWSRPVLPLESYDVSVCESIGSCPKSNTQMQYCPCLSLSFTDSCESFECWESSASGQSQCSTYLGSLIASCYCFADLVNMITNEGASQTIDFIKSIE